MGKAVRCLKVVGGNRLWVEVWVDHLQRRTLPPLSRPLTLLLDVPWGFAPQAFATYEQSDVLIYTDNPCSEYLEDLWDLGPRGLTAGELSLDAFQLILEGVLAGERVRVPPAPNTPLTKREREVLRLCALNTPLEEVADVLQLGRGTLRNHLSSIYGKLELSGLADLSAYYFGVKQTHVVQTYEVEL